MLLSIALFWFLALIAFVGTQWLAPALTPSTSSAPSGFNYGRAFLPLVKTLGFWMAIVLFALGPLAAVRMALERAGDAALGANAGNGTRGRQR